MNITLEELAKQVEECILSNLSVELGHVDHSFCNNELKVSLFVGDKEISSDSIDLNDFNFIREERL